jgi:ankyrin repeat protein
MAQTIVGGRQRSLLCLLPQEIVITIARFATLGAHSNLSRTCRYLTSILQLELFKRSNTDDNTYTALVYGCQNMDSNMVIGRALSYGVPPDVDHVLPNGDTALCIAAFHGCTTAVEYLLSRGANPDLTGAGDITPLGHGLRGCMIKVEPEEVWEEVRSRGQQYVEVMLRLLDNGANPHFNLPRDIGIYFDHDQSTPNAVSAVLDAILKTHHSLNGLSALTTDQGERLIRKLVLKGVSPNVFSTDEDSALSWAVFWYCRGTGSFNFIEFLLDHGADIRYGYDGRYPQLTALGVAISHMRADVVRYLLSRGAYPEFTRGDEKSLLWYAIKEWSDEETISVLLQAKADPNYIGAAEDPDDYRFRFCRTPLSAAVVELSQQEHQEKVMSMLLGHGANPNQRDRHGRTPLGEALGVADIPKRRNIVYLLLYSGADPNLVDHKGVKPLTAAVHCQDWYDDDQPTSEKKRLDIIDMLVKAGADPMKDEDTLFQGPPRLELELTDAGNPRMNFQDRLDDLKSVEELHTRRLAQLCNELPANGGVSGSDHTRISLRPVLYTDFGPKWRNKLVPRLLMAGEEVSGKDILNMRAFIEIGRKLADNYEKNARLREV